MKDTEIDAERLAALLDRRLDARARAALLEQIAASDEALAQLADAAGLLEELRRESADAAQAEKDANVRRWRWPRGGWFALAAVLVAVLVIPWLRGRTDANDSASRLARIINAGSHSLPSTWSEDPWSRTRGGTSPSSADVRGVRLGVYLVDFESARRGADPRAPAIAARIAALLNELPAGAALSRAYDPVAVQPQDSAGLAQARAAAVLAVGAESAALGSWIEQARLATAARDATFLRRLDVGEAERWLRRSSTATPAARDALRRIGEAVRAPVVDWPALEQDLTTLLGEVAGSR